MIAFACGGSSTEPSRPSPTTNSTALATPSPTIEPTRTPVTTPVAAHSTPTRSPGTTAAEIGPPIAATHGTLAPLQIEQDRLDFEPKAAYKDGVIFGGFPRLAPESSILSSYRLLTPADGRSKTLWEGVRGQQDAITGVDGSWVVTTRHGFSLPFQDWTIILRNLETGEARTLASADPAVVKSPGLHVDLPSGFSPEPEFADGRVVWDEHFLAGGVVGKRIQSYDIASGVTKTLVSVPDAKVDELRLPSLGGGKVAWIARHWDSPDAEISTQQSVMLMDIASAKTSRLPIEGRVWMVGLSPDGKSIAWDEGLVSLYAMRLDGGMPVQYGSGIGWGVTVSGNRASWQVANATQPVTGGYFDFAEWQVHYFTSRAEVRTNIAAAFGNWFVWSELVRGADGGNDLDHSFYYFAVLK